jgi:dihydroorotate dehydrogenase (NAD+) catalytic subunit
MTDTLTPDLTVELPGRTLRNPILTASGTFGYAKDYAGLLPLNCLGGVTVKGVSPFPSHGNPVPRTCEVYGGMLNAIGLQNPGLDKFIKDPDYLPFLRTIDTAVYINIWGKTKEDYVEVARRLDQEREGIDGLEVNISCPNIKEGGIAFGTDLASAARIVSAVRKATTLPLMTKLSPNVTDIGAFAKCVVDAGSDMVSLINTYPALAIDIETRKPKIANGYGGYSGRGIKPLALKAVHQAAMAVDAPVIGMGGIFDAEDAIEFFLAGASAIAVGTAIFADPQAPIKILEGITDYLVRHGHSKLTDIIGTLEFPA